MSDDAPTTPTTPATTDPPPTAVEETPATGAPPLEALQAEVDKWKGLARKHEDRSKANDRAVKELEEFRKANQTEQEKALDAARAEGRTAALRDVGSKLVYAEVRAAAAGKLSADQQTALLDGLDHMRFLDDAGEVDAGKVSKFVEALAPKPDSNGAPQPQRFDFGQGRREQVAAPKGAAGKAEAERRFGSLKTT